MEILLTRKRDKKNVGFTKGHALKLLRRNSKDWGIADSEDYEFKDNEIVRRKSNKGNSKKSEAGKGNSES
jgi:hypothetical protein